MKWWDDNNDPWVNSIILYILGFAIIGFLIDIIL